MKEKSRIKSIKLKNKKIIICIVMLIIMLVLLMKESLAIGNVQTKEVKIGTTSSPNQETVNVIDISKWDIAEDANIYDMFSGLFGPKLIVYVKDDQIKQRLQEESNADYITYEVKQ